MCISATINYRRYISIILCTSVSVYVHICASACVRAREDTTDILQSLDYCHRANNTFHYKNIRASEKIAKAQISVSSKCLVKKHALEI